MTYHDIVLQVAASNGLSANMVDKSYRAYWKVVREHIESLPLKQDLSDEEFKELRPNVNIPSIGKLHVTLDRYHGMKKYFAMYFKSYKGKKSYNNAKDKEN